MRRISILTMAVMFLGAFPVSASVTVNKTIRNCVHTVTGEARLVSAKVLKCGKAEKMVKIVLPVLTPDSHMHAGTGAPIDFQMGHDGDFYIDSIARKLYGPRIAGVWGSGTSMVGEIGPIGKTGSALISGVTPPDSMTGFIGDFYLDATTKIMYGPKDERAGWGVGSSITGPQGPQGNQGPQGPQGPAGGFGAYGSFYDTSTVTLVQNAATVIPIGVSQFAQGISASTDSKISMTSAGKYNIAFSIQIVKEDAGTDIVSIWLCRGSNGGICTNVPWTGTDLYLTGSDARQVAAWNFFVNSTPGDYFQLMISSSGTTLKTKILSTPAQSTPARPEIPGTILTVNQVG